jgi:hypothetical protein
MRALARLAMRECELGLPEVCDPMRYMCDKCHVCIDASTFAMRALARLVLRAFARLDVPA